MTRLAWQKYGTAVTAEMTVRYLRPAKTGELLTVRGDVTDAPGRLVEARASVVDERGTTIATATGKVIKTKKRTP
jgi:acyl-coenzyme A thioesterase PaaI-like protein